MKIYLIEHWYDEEGAFGDAEPSNEVVCCFTDEQTAKEYVAKWNCLCVYRKSYDYLSYGRLTIKEIEVNNTSIDYNPFEYFEAERARYLEKLGRLN